MNVYVKKPQLGWQKGVVYMAVVLALVIFLNMFATQARNSFFYVAAPLSKTLTQAGQGTANLFNPIFSLGAIAKENDVLKNQNQNLLASLATLQEAFRQHEDLKIVQDATANDNFTLRQAQVIGLDAALGTMLLNKGSRDGIAENMPVISSGKIVFGKVSAVYPNFSQVMLVSSQKSVLAVKVETKDPLAQPVYGVVKGKGSLQAYLDLVDSQSQLEPGQTLVTSAQDGIFPKDLLVGTVESANSNDAKAFQSAPVKPLFDPSRTESLFIITDYLKK